MGDYPPRNYSVHSVSTMNRFHPRARLTENRETQLHACVEPQKLRRSSIIQHVEIKNNASQHQSVVFPASCAPLSASVGSTMNSRCHRYPASNPTNEVSNERRVNFNHSTPINAKIRAHNHPPCSVTIVGLHDHWDDFGRAVDAARRWEKERGV